MGGSLFECIERDFGGGAGKELQGDPPKFCATYSSSALCANSFGPARLNAGWLRFGGHDSFLELRFEWKLPTGLRGEPPNLDFVAKSDTSILAVEGKFLETLDRKKPKFEKSYEEAYADCGCSVLEAAYLSVRDQPAAWCHLDVAQLLKHALGVIHCKRLTEPL